MVPANAAEILKQWTDVLGLPEVPSRTETVDGFPRQVWCDAAGNELVESYTITSMAHGTPLAVGAADDQCGAAGAFLLDVGISSSYHIAKFWGLAERSRVAEPRLSSVTPELAGRHASSEPANSGSPDAGNIRAIINRALQAAGLIKTP